MRIPRVHAPRRAGSNHTKFTPPSRPGNRARPPRGLSAAHEAGSGGGAPSPRTDSGGGRRGDLTNNATDSEFATYRAGTAASRLPVWPAVGNHEDFNGGAATYDARIDNYRRHVGPEWYSFDHGDRHFIVLENNGAAPFDEQREWAEQDLAAHARGKHVVVLMHQPMNVPFGSPSQYDAYQELLERYDTELILVGHEHSNDVDETSFVKAPSTSRRTRARTRSTTARAASATCRCTARASRTHSGSTASSTRWRSRARWGPARRARCR
jgi:hypothetical protein